MRRDFDMTDESNRKTSDVPILMSREKRIYYLYGDIDKETVAILCFNIIMHNIMDDEGDKKEREYHRKPIRIYINSYGGSVYNMWTLIDTIMNSRTPVYTHCDGYAMSAAFNIFLAGHRRFCSEYVTFMYHQMHCYGEGKYQDLVDDREQLDHLNECSEQYILSRTQISRKEMNVIREKKKDYYINAKKALEIGVVDEIIAK